MRGIAKLLSLLRLHHPRVPIVANTTARPLTRAWQIKLELQQQICRCVQWQRSVEFMRGAGITTFIEVGPGNVLSGLITRVFPEASVLNFGDKPSLGLSLP